MFRDGLSPPVITPTMSLLGSGQQRPSR
jgi:hypothetical protein